MGLMSCSIHSFTKEFDNLLTIAKIKRYSLLPYIEYTVRFFIYIYYYIILVRCTLQIGSNGSNCASFSFDYLQLIGVARVK